MSEYTSQKSLSLVALLLLTSLAGLVTLPTASAVNETTVGTITGTETWTGTMNLQGDVTVAEGSKLIVNAGTTINIPYGSFIDVEGAICIGSTSCGASAGSASNQARFIWSVPSASDYEKTGRCYVNGSNTYTNSDAGCGSGLIIRKTIDQSSTATGINYAHFENAYGYPIYVATLQQVQYGVLVFDGSSTTATGLSFEAINTSLYDRSAALFKAIACAIRTSRRGSRILLAESLFDEDLEVLETLAKETEIQFSFAKICPDSGVLDYSALQILEEQDTQELAAFVFPQVNKFGLLENVDALADFAKERGMRSIASIDG